MIRRQVLPAAWYIAGVSAIAALAWLAAWPIHSPAVSISTGVTAGWLAGMFLPCPRGCWRCHR